MDVAGVHTFCIHLGTLTYLIKKVMHGWNLIAFDIWGEYIERNVCQNGNCSGYDYNYKSGIGLLSPSDKFYIGCKSCTDTTVSYMIYSLKSMKTGDGNSCSSTPLTNALINTFKSCGDNTRQSGETCDDGNLDDGDGCDSHCLVEVGSICYDPGSSIPDICDICGDGKRPQPTGCDDGNNVNGDGCSSTCQIELGSSCSGGTSTTPDSCSSCGNGIIDNPSIEQCDDGNNISGDGCSSICKIETGWSCTRTPPTSPDVCVEICGDGKSFNSISTYCDDGNVVDGDGCSSTCSVETGWTCSGGTTSKIDVCKEICGDGIRFNSLSTYCDDGNLINGDGCNNICVTEACFSCNGGSPTSIDTCPYSCGTTSGIQCGNGVTQISINEQCDDGNNKSGDGCSNICKIESGYNCEIQVQLHYLAYCNPPCGNGKIETGEKCDDGNLINGDGCDSQCKVEYAYSCINYSNRPSFCSPNCGNGQRDKLPIFEECDDGNNISLDGCSGSCTVESNYVCNQNIFGTDICSSIYSIPAISNNTFDSINLQIIIEFDQVMMVQNVTGLDMYLDISGPNSPYDVKWTAVFDKNKFKISFTSYPVLLGGIGEKILLQLSNVLVFKSEHEICIAAPKIFEYTMNDLPPSESVRSGGSGFSYTFIFALLISLGMSLFTGGSIELMWSLANSLQIMFFYGLIDLYFTPEMQEIFTLMKFSNFDNPIFEYIRSKAYALLHLLNIPNPPNSQQFGLSFSSIILNFCDKFILILLLILFVLFIALLNYCLRKKTNKFAKFIKNKDLDIRYEGISRFFFEILLNLTFVCLVNIISGESNNLFEIISYVIAILFLIILFCILIYCFLYPFIYYSSLCTYPDKHERHCLLFLEFKNNKIRYLYFYAYFTTHRISFAIIIVCMNKIPVYQLVCIIIIHFLFLIYTFCPYKKSLVNLLHTFNCLIQLCLSCLLPLFLDSTDANKLKISGYIFIGIITVFFLINWFIVIPSVVVQFYQKFKKCCSKKTQEEIERERRIQSIIHVPSFNQSISFLNPLANNPKSASSVRPIVPPSYPPEAYDNIVIEKVRPKRHHEASDFQKVVEESKHHHNISFRHSKLYPP